MKHKSKIVLTLALILSSLTCFSFNFFQVQASEDASDEVIVVLETSMGNITIKLREDMPITAGNFLNLLQQGVYDNTIFHRVISDFMIQGGDPNGNGVSDDGIPTIRDEFTENNRNDRGTIAMANAGPNTGSSQFFINVKYNSHLDNQHPVFGVVIDGMDVVDAISEVETDGDPPFGANRPLEDVIINKTQVIPEFPQWLILSLFIIGTSLMVLCRKKRF